MRIFGLLKSSIVACVSVLVVACAPTIVDLSGGGETTGGNTPGAPGSTDVAVPSGAGGAGGTRTSGEGGAGSTSTSGEGGAGSTSAGAGGGLGCPAAALVGINWTGSAHQVARLDPASGVLTVLGPAPGVDLFIGFSGYDPVTKRIYEVGDGAIYAIDGLTGAVIYDTGTSHATSVQIVNPKVNTAGEIVILRAQTSWTVARLDPLTAAIADLGPSPYDGDYYDGMRAFDRATNRMYQFVEGRVITLDGTTGAVLADVAADEDLTNPLVNNAGAIIGELAGPGVFHMGRLNPATGAVTTLGSVPYGFGEGVGTYDPCTNRIYQVAGYQVLTLDGTTGAVLADVGMAQQNFLNFEAVW